MSILRNTIISIIMLVIMLPGLSTSSEENTADLVVTVLGSGTPVPSAQQFGTAILVEANKQYFLFDCGRGCTTRLAKLDPALITKINKLFVTHLHSDHIVGIDDLWLNGWTQGRTEPLRVWGPQGVSEMMKNMRRTFEFDINIRYADGVPATLDGISDAFTDISKGGVIYDHEGLKITAFFVDHSTVKPALGYRIDYKGRSIMISGDTTLTENLYIYGEGVDVILQEVMSPALISYLNANFQPKQVSKIVGYHTTAKQAADLFAKSSPRLAVYYHTRNDGVFANSLLEETRKSYAGPLKISHDLFQIKIGNDIETLDVSSDKRSEQ